MHLDYTALVTVAVMDTVSLLIKDEVRDSRKVSKMVRWRYAGRSPEQHIRHRDMRLSIGPFRLD